MQTAVMFICFFICLLDSKIMSIWCSRWTLMYIKVMVFEKGKTTSVIWTWRFIFTIIWTLTISLVTQM